ncbi:MAG: pilus assembly protein MshO [Methylophaga sp.]|nr:MAG: pilus assembly protein MshO [Methylophaga sp.]
MAKHLYPPHQSQRGFTLIEMIIVIVVGGIVAGITTQVLTQPINAYIDSTRRATLTATADSALKRMQRDIRRALPNSIRISADGRTLELLHLVDGGRYRSQLASDGSGNILDFSLTDTSFDALGPLQYFADISLGSDRVVVYPLNSVGSDPYAGDNTSIISNTSTATNIVFSAFQFPFSSPQQRFFIIDTPISYACDISATAAKDKVLMRYDGYAIQAAQPLPPASGNAIQANFISDCTFRYNAGSSTRAGLVSLELVVADETGESVRLLHQIHVDNQP